MLKLGNHAIDMGCPLTFRAILSSKFWWRWRGGYFQLCSVLRLAVHMTALQERMKGPRYECFGPYPVCPEDILP